MHDKWRSYDAFVSDMGERPRGASLTRRDVNGAYAPGNCTWSFTINKD